MNAKLRRAFEHAGFTVTTVERDGDTYTVCYRSAKAYWEILQATERMALHFLGEGVGSCGLGDYIRVRPTEAFERWYAAHVEGAAT